MKSHVCEVRGNDCGGDRNAPTVLFHGRGFPKFVHQNTLATFRTVGVSLIPASLHDPTVASCVFLHASLRGRLPVLREVHDLCLSAFRADCIKRHCAAKDSTPVFASARFVRIASQRDDCHILALLFASARFVRIASGDVAGQ